MFKNLLKLINSLYRKAEIIILIFSITGKWLDILKNIAQNLLDEFSFDTMYYVLPLFEKWLGIVLSGDETMEERRAAVAAKWRAKGHNSIALIQNIMDGWNPGASIVDFLGGVILIKITAESFIYKALKNVFQTIDNIKAAHLGLNIDVVQQNKVDIKFYGHTKITSTVLILSDEV